MDILKRLLNENKISQEEYDALINSIRQKGHWVFKNEGVYCSQCNELNNGPFFNFCSACGSDNREEYEKVESDIVEFELPQQRLSF